MMQTPPDPTVDRTQPRFRPVRAVGTFLQLLFGLFIISTSLLIVTGWAYRAALLDVARSRAPLGDAIRLEDNFLAASGVLGGINIVLVTCFVVWFWRAYSNLPALGRSTRRKAGWAVGGWVVPIINFYFPYQIGSEIWRKSFPKSAAPFDVGETNMEPVISWWALFLLMGLVNQVSFFSGRNVGDDLEKMAAVVSVDLIGGAVSIAAAVAALRFVREATNRQEKAMSGSSQTDGNPWG